MSQECKCKCNCTKEEEKTYYMPVVKFSVYEKELSTPDTLFLKTKKQADATIFTKVEILCQQKVMRFTFADGHVIKTICEDEKDFDFELAFYIALAKQFYGEFYTSEGIYYKAIDLMNLKPFVKMAKQGMKLYRDTIDAELERIYQESERQAQKEKQMQKKARRKEKAREKRITELTEAINRACSTSIDRIFVDDSK